MAEPYFDDGDIKLYQGDSLEVLRELPSGSVHMACTSPPFFGLRDYGTGAWEGGDEECAHAAPDWTNDPGDAGTNTPLAANQAKWHQRTGGTCPHCRAHRIDSQIGLESSPDEWAARLVDVFREVRRVLRDDGTLWVECGDSYNSSPPGNKNPMSKSGLNGAQTSASYRARLEDTQQRQQEHRKLVDGIKPKDLIGQPWLLAFALRADGWYLRSCIIWAKPNAMPESVTDRPTTGHSYVFLVSKKPRYFYDAESLREPAEWAAWGAQTDRKAGANGSEGSRGAAMGFDQYGRDKLREQGSKNSRSIWTIPTEPNALAICRVCDAYWQGGAPREHCGEPVVQHFAAFPRELVRRMILAGTSEKGVCFECGAPWVRTIEVEGGMDRSRPLKPKQAAAAEAGVYHDGQEKSGLSRAGWRDDPPQTVRTIGWRRSCDHDWQLAISPATILDPFSGSGTALLVARQLGRHAIGIELNERYAAMTRARMSQLSLLA